MSSSSSNSALLQQPETDRPKTDQQFLRFHLGANTAAMLPIAQLAEVLKIPLGKIVPLPHMPAWVAGVYNWRGEILWMVDLGHLVGLAPWYAQTTNRLHHIAIAIDVSTLSPGSGKQMLGLMVNAVDDIGWLNPDEIQSPPAAAVSPGLVPYLRGYWLGADRKMWSVLDGFAIAAAMPKS